uniref:Uncharacterized protein n=1 Tax=Xenopus tropicalis TaxID=8364 RepID=A0A803JJK4_XENTR
LLIVRIWRKQNENMDPSCLVTTVQAGGGGGVMVWGMFSWHTLGPLVPIGHRLNATAYLSISILAQNLQASQKNIKQENELHRPGLGKNIISLFKKRDPTFRALTVLFLREKTKRQ